MDRNRLKAAQNEFEMAESELDSAMQYTRESDEPVHADRFVNSQRSVERSTKAVFKLMNVQHPTEHVVSPASQEGRNLLNAISDEVTNLSYPEQVVGSLTDQALREIHLNEAARIMFLCEMYGNMYELAYYGISEPDLELAANDLIAGHEDDTALDSAVAALRISDSIIDSIAMGELPRSGRPASPSEGPLERLSAIEGNYGVGKLHSDLDAISDYRREL